jgi:hypothetical protein
VKLYIGIKKQFDFFPSGSVRAGHFNGFIDLGQNMIFASACRDSRLSGFCLFPRAGSPLATGEEKEELAF